MALPRTLVGGAAMDTTTSDFVRAGSFEELKVKGRLVVHGHNLTLVIAKAVHAQLAAGQSPSEVIRQAALFGTRNRDGWGTGLTILTALGNLIPSLPDEETYLALYQGIRRVAED